MSICQATGWVAKYIGVRKGEDYYYTRPVVCWVDHEDGSDPVGYVTPEKRTKKLRCAESLGGFLGYEEDNGSYGILPAQPGWWVILENRDKNMTAYAPVAAWATRSGGGLQPIVMSREGGQVIKCPDHYVKDVIYDPGFKAPKPEVSS